MEINELLRNKREEILRLAARRGAKNVRVFGPAVRREAGAERKHRYPEMGWFRIDGFRNVLVHDYLGVDLERVWNMIEYDLPALKRAVVAMLEEMD
jgi:uncharacterized protein with HEPN domain